MQSALIRCCVRFLFPKHTYDRTAVCCCTSVLCLLRISCSCYENNLLINLVITFPEDFLFLNFFINDLPSTLSLSMKIIFASFFLSRCSGRPYSLSSSLHLRFSI